MKRSATSLMLIAITAGAIAAAVIACSRAAQAGADSARALSRFDTLRTQARELGEVRAGGAVSAKPAEPKSPKLASNAADVLSAAGLPANALASLSPESESIERGGGAVPIARRRATLTLTPLTLPQLGRVLDLWRQRLPSWTISRIDLEPRREGTVAPGADLPLRAVLVVESIGIAPERRTP